MEKVNYKDTALLVMDVQGLTAGMLTDSTAFFGALNKAIQTARKNNMPVIYAVLAYRTGLPEANPNSKLFPVLQSMKLDSEEQSRVHEAVAPIPGDVVVTKKRYSAFTGSDLEVVLRAKGIKHLVLTGLSTSGVVLSTLREASDKDYMLTVLADCCADRDEEVHRVLITKVFPRQADVLTAEEWSS